MTKPVLKKKPSKRKRKLSEATQILKIAVAVQARNLGKNTSGKGQVEIVRYKQS